MSNPLLKQALDYVSHYVGIDDKQADMLHAALLEQLAKPAPEPVARVESFVNSSYGRKYTVSSLKNVEHHPAAFPRLGEAKRRVKAGAAGSPRRFRRACSSVRRHIVFTPALFSC